MRHRVGLMAFGAILLLSAACAWYARPIVAARRIGIPWRTTLQKSHCTRLPSEVNCTTGWSSAFGQQPVVTTILFQPWSRELLRADRTWTLQDSATWARLVDSTQRALTRRGWQPLPCDTATQFPIADAWRIDRHEIRFYAAPRIQVQGIGVRRYANVQLVALGAAGCGPRYGVRLLTPAEMARAVRDWVATQIGFR